MTLIEILKLLAPIIGGFLGVGGIGAYYSYRSTKPKTEAEAKKVDADVVVTFAEGWQKYAEKLEKRLDDTEKGITALKAAMENQATEYKRIIAEKDTEIKDLQDHNRSLENRIDDLENELTKYKQIDTKVNTVRGMLHEGVEVATETLKEKLPRKNE